jgi:hypothetical protein
MSDHQISFSSAGLDVYTQILTQSALYLILRYANLPDTLASEEREAIQAGIRRSLEPLLGQLDEADPGALSRFRETVPAVAELMDQGDLG